MSKQTLNAKVRTVSGKTAAKKLRQVGSIPAVMYNEKGESTNGITRLMMVTQAGL